MKSNKQNKKFFHTHLGTRYGWIKKFAKIELAEGYSACFNTLFMTRIYYKQRLQSVVDYFSEPHSKEDIEWFLEQMPWPTRNETYDFICKAIDRHFLVDTNFSEKDKFAELTRYMAGDGVEISGVYMIFSLNCNLRCPYCLTIKNCGRSGHPVMTTEEIAKYIDYFCLNMRGSKRDPDMLFYGGEPLLYPSLLKHSVLYAEKKAKTLHGKFKYIVVTNGTISNDDFFRFARDYNVSVIVSLDGFAPQHDKFRIDKNGRGSFKRAIAFSDRAIKEKLDVTFSITATPHNLPAMPRFFAWLNKRFGGRSFGINRLYNNLTKHTQVRQEYYRQIERLFFYCATHDIAEGTLMRRWNSFETTTPYTHYCGGVGNQAVFLPGGLVGPCHGFCDTCYRGRRKNFVNIPHNILLKDHPLWKKWDLARAHNISECVNRCNIFSLCGGGCAYHAYMQNKSIHSCDKSFCRLMESMLSIYLQSELNEKMRKAKLNLAAF